MNVNVISVNDKTLWNRSLAEFNHDIYHTAEYHEAFEKEFNGEAIALMFNEGDNKFFHTFIKTPIENYTLKGFYDAQTVYGYGGPLSTSHSSDFVDRCKQTLKEYGEKNNIVGEFVRFHPLLKNYVGFEDMFQLVYLRHTVAVDLQLNVEQIWAGLTGKNRNMIRKAQKANLKVTIHENANEYLDEFLSLYYATMNRNNASSFYYFSKTHLRRKMELLSPSNLIMAVRLAGQMIAGAIFLMGSDYLHYDLAASQKEFLTLAPNNLLLWEAINYGKNLGLKKLHLGGGNTGDDDSLFSFKKSFASQGDKFNFVIGRNVYLPDINDQFIKEWKSVNAAKIESVPTGYFPVYRL